MKLTVPLADLFYLIIFFPTALFLIKKKKNNKKECPSYGLAHDQQVHEVRYAQGAGI